MGFLQEWSRLRTLPRIHASSRICNPLVDIVAQVNLEAAIDILAPSFSEDAAKGLALYGGTAARTSNESASRNAVRISIVAKQSDV